ncbi:Inositol phosphosphingolipids phospholipase C [Cytospora mali]|uniref:Inositol phosphosphingolipids phospholipase C n=1 Tax=Cytospora mali TaxID=578113 RepID=A0A194UXX8_CYTMA|nr:Inositol phosphosphingolipids phospholipase C [Valsa mali var. pyri (nom. inval.)]
MDTPLPPEINITTLNCWGLKFNISKLRQPRLQEIARQLAQATPQPTIVCLQEIWSHADYLTVRQETHHLLPHGKFYFSGAFGGGLAILSQWPIEEASMVPYSLNGRPTAFWRGDWYVGKGVASARVRYGPGDEDVLEVFNTHTHAPYSSDRADTYRVHREAQAWQLAKMLRGAAERGHLVVAAGDFNMTPLSAAHRIITGCAPVRDVWRVLHPDSSLGCVEDEIERERGRDVPSAGFNVLENGKRLGPGKPVVEVANETADPRGKRLDYIFAGAGARELEDGTIGGWVVRDARVGMTQRHPELGCSLSDHFSVEATLVFHQTSREGLGSLNLKWPLPPGVCSSLSAFRRSTLRPGRPETLITYDNNSTNNADASPETASPAGGAFLQLHTPTASSNRSSYIQEQDQHSRPLSATDLDTQLLSSISLYPSPTPFTAADYDTLLSSLSSYQAREATQTKYRTLHFLSWVIVTIVCYIAVWFIPTHSENLTAAQNHGINFLLLLLSSLGLVAGCLDGLMSLLFFRGSEKRALKEFEWELKNGKCLTAGEGLGAADEDIGAMKF